MTLIDTCAPAPALTRVTLIGNGDGTRYELITPCAPYFLGNGADLRGMGPWAVASEIEGPLIPGEKITSVRAVPRTLMMPIVINSPGSEAGLDTATAALNRQISPNLGDCRILYQRADGVQREITARYTGGVGGLEVVYLNQQRHLVAKALFRAHFPFWRDPTETIQFASLDPFSDGRGAGSNPVQVTNGGDVEVWPEIIVTGYAEAIEGTNLTTAKVFRITRVIGQTDVLRIVTDPHHFGVYINDVEAQGAVDPISEFWPLIPFDNELLFRANTAADTQTIGGLSIRWNTLYGTP